MNKKASIKTLLCVARYLDLQHKYKESDNIFRISQKIASSNLKDDFIDFIPDGDFKDWISPIVDNLRFSNFIEYNNEKLTDGFINQVHYLLDWYTEHKKKNPNFNIFEYKFKDLLSLSNYYGIAHDIFDEELLQRSLATKSFSTLNQYLNTLSPIIFKTWASDVLKSFNNYKINNELDRYRDIQAKINFIQKWYVNYMKHNPNFNIMLHNLSDLLRMSKYNDMRNGNDIMDDLFKKK